MKKSSRRHRYGPRISIQPGQAPAMIEPRSELPFSTIRVITFDAEKAEEFEFATPEDLRSLAPDQAVTWIHVDGIHQARGLKEIADIFDLPLLAMEDMDSTGNRPKAEQFGDWSFVIAQAAVRTEPLKIDQLGILYNDRMVLTFSEGSADYLNPVRWRVTNSEGRIRRRPADYLAYAIIDSAVDHFFPAIDRLGEVLEMLEDEVILAPKKEMVGRIHAIKRDLITLRRTLTPMRDAVGAMAIESMVDETTRPFLRDCHDHLLQAIDLVDTYREVAAALTEIYLSALSQRMNEVMKMLTLMASIFIPLTFIAGLYGMNFDPDVSPWNMPELKWAYGYPAVLAVMAAVAIGLLLYFRKKNWL